MKKIYDKIFLAIGALVLLGGVFLYLKNSSLAPTLLTPIDVALANNPYEDEEIPSSLIQEAIWPEPIAQSAGPEWIYDVFTPPEIYLDQSGNFVPTGWKPAPPPPPFGIYLSDIVRKPYRIQLEGYIEEDRSDSSKSLLLLSDEEANKQVRVRPGNQSVTSEFKVISFSITRIRDTDGNIEIKAQASILDNRTGKEVLLTHGERLFLEDVTVVIRSDDFADYRKELSEAPSTFDGPASEYTLLEINLEDSTILVEKHATDSEPSDTRILEARSFAPNQNTSPASNPDPLEVF